MGRNQMLGIGVVLLIVGVIALFWQKFSYTERETLVNVGGVKVTADTEKSVPVSPIVGGILMTGGVGLMVAGALKK